MHFSVPIVMLVAADVISATSISHSNAFEKRSFNVPRVATGPAPNKNIAKAMKDAMIKHNIPIPAGLANADEAEWEAPPAFQHANAKKLGPAFGAGSATTPTPAAGSPTPAGSGSGQVANTPLTADSAYVAQVTIGGQKLTMDFDTGSSDLWVFNPSLPAQDLQGHTVYDPSKSSTWKQMQGSTFKLAYADKSEISGNMVGTDSVTIGSITYPNQVVELPNTLSQKFATSDGRSGLVGLARSGANQVKPQSAKTFFDNVSGQLKEPILGANLKHGQVGSYDFGEVDSSAFKGPLRWVDSPESNPLWSFESTNYAVGTGSPLKTTLGLPAIADTGTTLMLVDPGMVKNYWGAVQGAQADPSTGMYSFPCNAQLPDLHVQLAPGEMSTIPGALLNFQPISGGNGGAKRRAVGRRGPDGRRITHERRQQQAGGMCAGALQPIGNGATFQIYGDVMFKAQYVVFNQGNSSVGFAPHA